MYERIGGTVESWNNVIPDLDSLIGKVYPMPGGDSGALGVRVGVE